MIGPLAMSFVVSLLLQPLAIRQLRRSAVLDSPNRRSSHVVPTPRGGGFAVMAGFALGLVVSGELADRSVWIVLVATLALATLGAVEDVVGVPSLVRLVVQLVVGAAAAVLVGGAPWQVIVAAAFIAAYVNAFNFMDGINGISGMNAGVAGVAFALMARGQQLPSLETAGLVLAAAALGFLPWNIPVAKVFLGDVGSYGLGAAIAVMGISLVAAGVPPILVLAPLSIYLADTGYTLVRRALSGEAVLEAHRSHVYQRLTDAGIGHAGVAVLTAALAAWVTACTWAAVGQGTAAIAGLFGTAALLPVILYLLLPRWLSRPAESVGA